MANTYEDSALADSLSAEQMDRLIASFAKEADVVCIAHELDLPLNLVLRVLEDGQLAERAIAAKRGAVTVRFVGAAIDRLQAIVEAPPCASSPAEQLQSIKLLRDFLGLRPAPQRADRPPPKAKPDDKQPSRTVGLLEAALMADEEEDD